VAHSTLRGIAATAAKAAVSVGLIALALRGIDSKAVLQHLRAIDGWAVVIATVVTTAISLLHARRWQIILARMGHYPRFTDVLRLVLIGYFFNQTLPSTVGGDAYRAWGAYRLGIRARDSITSVVVDRILALASLVLMITMGLWWLLDIIRTPTARWIVVTVIAASVIGVGILLALARFAPSLQRWRATRFLVQVSEGCRAVAADRKATLHVILLTIAGYVAISYAAHVLARGLGIELEWVNSLLLVPLVTLVAVLPVSIAGWGVREGAMVVALGLIGIPSVQAFSLSVLYGLVVMASGVPGGLLWLLARRHRPVAGQPTPSRVHGDQ
jgi:uncharacterized protein (TIRG00374 family)